MLWLTRASGGETIQFGGVAGEAGQRGATRRLAELRPVNSVAQWLCVGFCSSKGSARARLARAG